MDYFVEDLPEDYARGLTSKRWLTDATDGQAPSRASYVTPRRLLLPSDLVVTLRGLPDHYDGHVAGDPATSLLIWFGGNAYPLTPAAAATSGKVQP